MKRRKKRRTRKTTGSSYRAVLFSVLLAGLLAWSGLAAKPSKKSRTNAADPAALIAVSVFREPGFAVSAAEIELSATPDETSGAKMKKWKATADARGEFVFRVPPAAMRYTVSASGRGLKAQQKTLTVEGEGRFDVTFMLEQESK
jgi:hypothetical protein